MKKLEIGRTKPTFIISVLEVEPKVVLVSSISNFFTNKTSLENKWRSFTSSNAALIPDLIYFIYIWLYISFEGIILRLSYFILYLEVMKKIKH